MEVPLRKLARHFAVHTLSHAGRVLLTAGHQTMSQNLSPGFYPI